MTPVLLIPLVLLLFLLALILFRTALFSRTGPTVDPAPEMDVDPELVAGHLGRAIHCQTISNEEADPIVSGSYARVQAFVGLHRTLQDMYPRAHRSLNVEQVNNFSLLYTWQGADPALEPALLLAHLDVAPVEPGSESDWTYPPFAGQVADGFVWGRGAIDCKNGVVGILEAVEWLLRNGYKPRRTVMIAFGHDEELDGLLGAKKIAQVLEKRGLTFQSILDEGSFLLKSMVPGVERPVGLVGAAEKGYLNLELSVNQEGGHSSMPSSQTAIGILGRAIANLEIHPAPAHLDPAITLFRYLGEELSLGMRLIFANAWLFGGLIKRSLSATPETNALIRTTTAVTIIKGGSKDNVLPRQAKAVVNCRILPGENVESTIHHVRSAISDPRVKIGPLQRETEKTPEKTNAGSKLSQSGQAVVANAPDDNAEPVNGWNPSLATPLNSSEYRLLERTIRQVFPEAIVAPYLLVATTDSRHYTALSPNIFRFMPVLIDGKELAGMHGVNERISLENCARMVRFYIQWIRNSSG
ncbi:MAG TPA: M20 family peptidase [Anaerolineaceae bacterium]|nr:M20 family peptidase [Anaerolineaceae bacterium]